VVSGKHESLTELRGVQGTVIMFICNHCPFVLHVNEALVELANDYTSKGIAFIAISSNSVESHPQDGPDQMKIHADQQNYPFPYLYDESQEVAKAYSAACTPDFSVFDADLICVYRGQLDDSRPGMDSKPTGEDIRKVCDAILTNGEISQIQKPSIGCNIKWKI